MNAAGVKGSCRIQPQKNEGVHPSPCRGESFRSVFFSEYESAEKIPPALDLWNFIGYIVVKEGMNA